MPMELLRRLANEPLPLTLRDPADIDRLRVLRAAELVSAMFPPVEAGGDTAALPPGGARVLCITAKGRSALAEEALPEGLG